MALRSFLAFNLPVEIKNKIAQISGVLKRSSIDARWVKADNIHLTIVFLGDIRQEDLIPMRKEIRDVCTQNQAFEISLRGIGLFPNRRRPRVIWLGLDGELEEMSGFRDELQGRLVSFGIKAENRGFQPHITLGRFRKPDRIDSDQSGILSGYEELQGPAGQLNELIMFRSELKPGGAVYSVIDSWPLSSSS